MSKKQCIKATQRMAAAELCGPLSEDDAKEKWNEVNDRAKVISDSPRMLTTPTKKNKKKKPQTPKKKKFFYAVTVGKVPGVYDT